MAKTLMGKIVSKTLIRPSVYDAICLILISNESAVLKGHHHSWDRMDTYCTLKRVQRSHVPKFGNWDGENVPYTAYFDNARKERGSGAKMVNPNDPEENPDFFTGGIMGRESYGGSNVVQAPPSRTTSEHANREEGRVHRNTTNQNINLDQQKSRSRKNINSESSSSDRSLLQPNHHRTRSSQKKNFGEGSNSCSPSSPLARHKSRNPREDQQQRQGASVPKFGSWDETDPASGEGFTIIFNKVKEEKQIGASKLSTIPTEPTVYNAGQRNRGSSSPCSKSCCGLFSRSKK